MNTVKSHSFTVLCVFPQFEGFRTHTNYTITISSIYLLRGDKHLSCCVAQTQSEDAMFRPVKLITPPCKASSTGAKIHFITDTRTQRHTMSHHYRHHSLPVTRIIDYYDEECLALNGKHSF